MGTIFPPHSLSPLLNIKPSPSRILLAPCPQPKSNSLFCSKPIVSSLRKNQTSSPKPSSGTSWLAHAQQGLAALAISLALNFSPVLFNGNALASEFDVLNEGPPKDSYVFDDAGVLSRVTRSDLKQLLSDLESRKNFRINFITVRKLTVSYTTMCLNNELWNFLSYVSTWCAVKKHWACCANLFMFSAMQLKWSMKGPNKMLNAKWNVLIV